MAPKTSKPRRKRSAVVAAAKARVAKNKPSKRKSRAVFAEAYGACLRPEREVDRLRTPEDDVAEAVKHMSPVLWVEAERNRSDKARHVLAWTHLVAESGRATEVDDFVAMVASRWRCHLDFLDSSINEVMPYEGPVVFPAHIYEVGLGHRLLSGHDLLLAALREFDRPQFKRIGCLSAKPLPTYTRTAFQEAHCVVFADYWPVLPVIEGDLATLMDVRPIHPALEVDFRGDFTLRNGHAGQFSDYLAACGPAPPEEASGAEAKKVGACDGGQAEALVAEAKPGRLRTCNVSRRASAVLERRDAGYNFYKLLANSAAAWQRGLCHEAFAYGLAATDCGASQRPAPRELGQAYLYAAKSAAALGAGYYAVVKPLLAMADRTQRLTAADELMRDLAYQGMSRRYGNFQLESDIFVSRVMLPRRETVTSIEATANAFQQSMIDEHLRSLAERIENSLLHRLAWRIYHRHCHSTGLSACCGPDRAICTRAPEALEQALQELTATADFVDSELAPGMREHWLGLVALYRACGLLSENREFSEFGDDDFAASGLQARAQSMLAVSRAHFQIARLESGFAGPAANRLFDELDILADVADFNQTRCRRFTLGRYGRTLQGDNAGAPEGIDMDRYTLAESLLAATLESNDDQYRRESYGDTDTDSAPETEIEGPEPRPQARPEPRPQARPDQEVPRIEAPAAEPEEADTDTEGGGEAPASDGENRRPSSRARRRRRASDDSDSDDLTARQELLYDSEEDDEEFNDREQFSTGLLFNRWSLKWDEVESRLQQRYAAQHSVEVGAFFTRVLVAAAHRSSFTIHDVRKLVHIALRHYGRATSHRHYRLRLLADVWRQTSSNILSHAGPGGTVDFPHPANLAGQGDATTDLSRRYFARLPVGLLDGEQLVAPVLTSEDLLLRCPWALGAFRFGFRAMMCRMPATSAARPDRCGDVLCQFGCWSAEELAKIVEGFKTHRAAQRDFLAA